MICITIQRTLSVAKVRYLIGDKECFKIFYPRFFAWINLFIKPYSSLFFAISISIHSNICGKGSCFEWSISFAYSHPFVCFVYKSAVVEERQSSYLRLTSSDYGTARKILGGMPWNTSRLYCQGLFFVCRADNGWLL